jgi:hypothetical protein
VSDQVSQPYKTTGKIIVRTVPLFVTTDHGVTLKLANSSWASSVTYLINNGVAGIILLIHTYLLAWRWFTWRPKHVVQGTTVARERSYADCNI